MLWWYERVCSATPKRGIINPYPILLGYGLIQWSYRYCWIVPSLVSLGATSYIRMSCCFLFSSLSVSSWNRLLVSIFAMQNYSGWRYEVSSLDEKPTLPYRSPRMHKGTNEFTSTAPRLSPPPSLSPLPEKWASKHKCTPHPKRFGGYNVQM